jgi:pilus assembly protein CpaB
MIKRGTALTRQMIKPLEAEEPTTTGMNIFFDQHRRWLGAPLARDVKPDEPLLISDFLSGPTPSSQFVEEGWRAVTIGVDQISGVAGLVTPGARVDILYTFREVTRGPEALAPVVTQVIAQNIEVLAVDNRTDVSAPIRPGTRAPQVERGYSSITLLVTPLEASLLTFTQGSGKLSLALRRTGDNRSEGINPIDQSRLRELITKAAAQREQLTTRPEKATTQP